MNKLHEIRKKAAGRLLKAGSDSPKSDIDYLLSRCFGLSKSDIILGETEFSDEAAARLSVMLKRLESGEPVQYIAGICEFMSEDFIVNPSTLIPRQDTEILTETVIDRCCGIPDVKILEIGTGSGCIAVSLAKYLPSSEVWAIDISPGALRTAQLNSKRCSTDSRTHFFVHDIMTGFPPLPFVPDVIVSNPPYIPSADIPQLEKKVCSFEPLSALDGGTDGLDFYRKITADVRLTRGGILAYEVGCGQSHEVAAIMRNAGMHTQFVRDLSGIERVVVGTAPYADTL